jgi:hypothetical protein
VQKNMFKSLIISELNTIFTFKKLFFADQYYYIN